MIKSYIQIESCKLTKSGRLCDKLSIIQRQTEYGKEENYGRNILVENIPLYGKEKMY